MTPSPAARRPRPAPPVSPGSGRSGPSAPSAALAPSAASTRSAATSSPSSRPSASARRRSRSGPAVRAPSPISSSTTIAALGPPIPVDWMVSGSPSARRAGVAPQPARVVEHQRLLEQRLRDRERAVGVAGQQHALGERGGGAQVDGRALGHGPRRAIDSAAMAKPRPRHPRRPARRGGAHRAGHACETRERAQDAVDDLAGTVDELRQGRREERSRAAPQRARRDGASACPATQEDIEELRGELRAIAPPARGDRGAPAREAGARSRSRAQARSRREAHRQVTWPAAGS